MSAFNRRHALLPLCAAIAALGGNVATAACVSGTPGGDPYNPTAGQSVSCTATLPNPDPQAIAAQAGANNVAVVIGAGAQQAITSNNGVLLRNLSTLTNDGTLSATGAGFAGVVLAGGGNQVLNNGTISGAAGLTGSGGANTLTNNSTGTIIGTAGPAVSLSGGAVNIINSGILTGTGGVAVATGAGTDTFEMRGGTVNGNIDQGDGVDQFIMAGGTVNGVVQQGNGIDDFRMTGGQIGALQQGDNRDTFFMSGGTIVGAFEDGDVATMTGGTIGRVDMKLDNNIFDMSGGRINGNLVAGFGNDTITVSNGFIGGNISVSGGTDIVTITGGEVVGEVRMSTGDDVFTWSDGGIVRGFIDMGTGADLATLRNLSAAQVGTTVGISGGVTAGSDTLVFDNTQAAGVNRFTSFETINLQRGSALTMDNRLILGDAESLPSVLNIDATSRLTAVAGINGSVSSSVATNLPTVNNAGTIDLTGGNAANRMTIVGNYVGAGGTLKVDAILGADGAPADSLIVSGGQISGNTTVAVNNLGGLGGLTTANGIQVVQAINGATSTGDAFAMPTELRAGAYQYFLFKGGVTAGSENSWYLRSSVPATAPPPTAPPFTPPVTPPVVPPVVPPVTPPVDPTVPPLDPADPTAPTPPVVPSDPNDPTNPTLPPDPAAPVAPAPAGVTPTPAPGQSAPLPAAVADAVPIYREEVPVYGAVTATARQLALFSLGTFHDRQGEQSILGGEGGVPATWSRVFGQHTERHYSGGARSEFDGSMGGVQVGQDLYSVRHANGHQDRVGAFLGYSHASGDVRGLALATPHSKVGSLKLDGYSAGAYWTHVGPAGGYTDAVAMVTRLDARLRSTAGMREKTDGTATTLSLEGGYPLQLTDRVVLEPQAQFIAQFLSVDSLRDSVSRIDFKDSDTYTGRVGLRLKGTYDTQAARLEPYVRANLWREFAGTDKTVYDRRDTVGTRFGSTALQFGAGLVAQVNKTVSVYAAADYTTDVDGKYRRDVAGNIGVRINW